MMPTNRCSVSETCAACLGYKGGLICQMSCSTPQPVFVAAAVPLLPRLGRRPKLVDNAVNLLQPLSDLCSRPRVSSRNSVWCHVPGSPSAAANINLTRLGGRPELVNDASPWRPAQRVYTSWYSSGIRKVSQELLGQAIAKTVAVRGG